MITYYCPNCWREISEHQEECPGCGYALASYSRLSLEEKLVMALHHPLTDKRMMAIRVLGSLGSSKALPEFERMIEDSASDFYLLREVIDALSRIDDPNSAALLRKAGLHSSPLIRRLAGEQLKKSESV